MEIDAETELHVIYSKGIEIGRHEHQVYVRRCVRCGSL